MKPPRRGLAALTAALISAAAVPSASADNAQDTSVARDLFREGAALAQGGNWEQALDRYARSLRLKRSSLTLYSLGVAQKQLGKLIEARQSFTAFLAEPSSTATQPFEQPAKTAIEDIDAHVGRLTIQVSPPDVPNLFVQLDGNRFEASDLGVPRPVNPGPHEIKASGDGRAPARSKVTVRGGEAITAALTLRPIDEVSAPPPIETEAPAEASDRTFPLVVMGTGFSIAATGLTVGLLGVLDAGNAPTSDGFEAKSASSKKLIGGVVGGAGVAMLGAGLIVYLIGAPSKPDPKQTTFVTPWAKGDVAGVKITF